MVFYAFNWFNLNFFMILRGILQVWVTTESFNSAILKLDAEFLISDYSNSLIVLWFIFDCSSYLIFFFDALSFYLVELKNVLWLGMMAFLLWIIYCLLFRTWPLLPKYEPWLYATTFWLNFLVNAFIYSSFVNLCRFIFLFTTYF